MRIGIVTGEYPPMQGGVGAYTAILAQALVNAGHRIRICTRTAANSPPSDDSNIQIDSIITRWDWSALQQVRTWAQKQQLELVNIQFQTAAFDMSPWIHFLPTMLRPIPVVTTFHDLRVPYLFPKAGKLRNWIVMQLAKRSAGVIVTNHEDEQQLSDLPRRALIPIGSNILKELGSFFNTSVWRQRAHATEQDFLIAYFGLANHTKGLDTLIAALSNLRSQGIPARLVMIGSVAGSSDPTNRTFAEQLNAHIDQSRMRPFIHQTGFVDEHEVGAYLTAADVVALPFRDGASFRRGSLMAPIHYGCAIVTTTPAIAIPEFQDRQNMLLVRANHVPELTDGLRQVYESPILREQLKRGALALKPLFDWEQIARQTIDLFKQVVQ